MKYIQSLCKVKGKETDGVNKTVFFYLERRQGTGLRLDFYKACDMVEHNVLFVHWRDLHSVTFSVKLLKFSHSNGSENLVQKKYHFSKSTDTLKMNKL